MTDDAPWADCMWCGQTGRLATFTPEGEADETTPCVCVLSADLALSVKERAHWLAMWADENQRLVRTQAALLLLRDSISDDMREWEEPEFAQVFDAAREVLEETNG